MKEYNFTTKTFPKTSGYTTIRKPLVIFWFRRDLRLEDNCGLYHALTSGHPVLPLFIFDKHILDQLTNRRDRRVQFIYRTLQGMQNRLTDFGCSLQVEYGIPIKVWERFILELPIAAVFTNHDYEPYARERDAQVKALLIRNNISFRTFKDQVIFEKNEILNKEENPYSVYTPYRNKWREKLSVEALINYPSEAHLNALVRTPPQSIPSLEEMGFEDSNFRFPPNDLPEKILINYHQTRDFPGLQGTTHLGVHLRFGTLSIRRVVQRALELNEIFLDELIWREFFMMHLWYFPHLVNEPFRERYRNFPWRNDRRDFLRWSEGNTGFPLVDAGMRQLNTSGYMHNRVRMLTANFLTRLLLIDWRWGEAYFAEKLLDYEQASNVGNWQWSAGCGSDAVPYFRIFNPEVQLQKFDPDCQYVKYWISEFATENYPKPMIDYRIARQRALDVFAR